MTPAQPGAVHVLGSNLYLILSQTTGAPSFSANASYQIILMHGIRVTPQPSSCDIHFIRAFILYQIFHIQPAFCSEKDRQLHG